MSKYLIFPVLLFSLNTNAQQTVSVEIAGSKSNNFSNNNSQWDEQKPYVNGYARVLQNNKFSFINKAGNVIRPVEFEGVRNFNNHLAAVNKNDKWGFINEEGIVIIPIAFDTVFDFNEKDVSIPLPSIRKRRLL